MKNSIFRSFRFEIVLYSLLSLLYTLLTIAIINTGIFLLFRGWVNNITGSSSAIILSLTVFAGILLFILYFLMLTKKFVTYIRDISEGINEISMGNLDNRIMIRNEDEFAFLADKLNRMADDIKGIMENERRIENSKNELITSVAHDLRTPLTSITGYLELVSTKELDTLTQRKYIDIAYNKSKRLEKLIEDLFTYTKFNFGEVRADYSEVDMVKLMNQLIDEFYPSFAEYHLSYEFTFDHPMAIIWADGNLLARAFANLISNAIKYGREGKNIVIKLNKTDDGGVIISVTNHGIVIPPEDLERIFIRFYRVESSRSSETGGSGLGLAIAKSIIEMHGGTIYAESDGQKTVFTIILKNKPQDTN